MHASLRPHIPEIRAMWRLALPLIFTELGWMAMGLVDTMFVGRIGAAAIGAVGLGAQIYYAIAICSGCVLFSLDTVVSQAHGAGDSVRARAWLVNGIWLAAFLTPFVMGLVWTVEPLLGKLGIDPSVLATSRPYLRALNYSTPALMLYFALRRYVQALGIVRPVMIILVTANVINLAGNWVLVLGRLGAPRMGAEGSGWATCISRLYMAAMMVVVVIPHARGARISWRPDFSRIAVLLKLGIPAAGQIGVEIAVFTTVTVLIGRINAVSLAANQIALNTVSTTFMMPLGVSSAAAVRVGHALGRNDSEGASRAGWTALALGAAVMSVAALALLGVPGWIARLFTPEVSVSAAAAVLLRVAAFFQLFDGLQVVATGALRGAGDTHTAAVCHFVGYWVIGLPVGAVLCFGRGLGAPGLWAGLTLGLIVIGIILVMAWRRKARHLAPLTPLRSS
jgi:MATE family multidrug resistance protein